jgi:LPXTG-site transpeptidase (sortase) family protein
MQSKERMSIALSEREIAAILLRPRSPFERLLPVLRPVFAAVLTVGILFGGYSYFGATPADRTVSAAPQNQIAANTPVATPTAQPTATPAPQPITPENTLVYSDFNVSAPIIWDTPFSSQDVDTALGDGLVHLAGTPLPGQPGFTVIFGHSSALPWVKGNYKDVFAPIIQAKPGQEVLLTYNGTSYRYRVTQTFEVKPTDLGILESKDTDLGLRLVTCTPIGTSLRRFVVEAIQIPL